MVTATIARTESIRGRVVYPDGKPASNIEVHAFGSGQGMDNGQGRSANRIKTGRMRLTSARVRPTPSMSTTKTGPHHHILTLSSVQGNLWTLSTSSSPGER